MSYGVETHTEAVLYEPIFDSLCYMERSGTRDTAGGIEGVKSVWVRYAGVQVRVNCIPLTSTTDSGVLT